MKRLIITFVFAMAALLAALIPLSWVHDTPTAQAQSNARVWVAHLAPFTNTITGTAVNVAVDGQTVLSDLKYKETSEGYLDVPAGDRLIQVFLPTGGDPVISATATLTEGMEYTVVAIGDDPSPPTDDNQPLEFLILEDDNATPTSGNGKLRVVHAAPFSNTITGTLVDVRNQDGSNLTPPINNVPYKINTGYIELPAGLQADLKVTTPGGGVTAIDIPPFQLKDGEIVTIFAIGDDLTPPTDSNQPLEDFSIVYSTADVYVVHAAPFTNTITNTAVTVRINGTDALTDFKYLQTSGKYVSLPSISTTVEIVAGGNTVTSATLDLAPNIKYTVAAIGNDPTDPKDMNQPVELLALVDEEAVSTTAKVRIVHAAPFSNVLTDTQVDILNQDGSDLMLNGIAYKQFTDPYVQLSAGTYDFKINQAGTMTTAIDIPAFSLSNGDIVTIFAVGDGNNQDLGILTIPELKSTVYLPIVFKN